MRRPKHPFQPQKRSSHSKVSQSNLMAKSQRVEGSGGYNERLTQRRTRKIARIT
jgi:hypothetical protein